MKMNNCEKINKEIIVNYNEAISRDANNSSFILKEEKLSTNMEISKEQLKTLIILFKSIQILQLFFIKRIPNINMEISKGQSKIIPV